MHCKFCGLYICQIEGNDVCLNHEDAIVIFRGQVYDLVRDEYEITVNLEKMNMTLYTHNNDEENCELSPMYDYFAYGTEIMTVDINKEIKPEEFCKTLIRLKKMIPFS